MLPPAVAGQGASRCCLSLQIPLPNRPHWFLLFGATEEEIQEICIKILQLYTRRKVLLACPSSLAWCGAESSGSDSMATGSCRQT